MINVTDMLVSRAYEAIKHGIYKVRLEFNACCVAYGLCDSGLVPEPRATPTSISSWVDWGGGFCLLQGHSEIMNSRKCCMGHAG